MVYKIFLTGATGYIGGSVLTRLLQSPNKYSVSALIRNKDQGEVLQKLGVTPIYGTLDDRELLKNVSTEVDAVINTANADHLPSVQAIVEGLKSKGNKNAVLLHTSGTGVLTSEPTTEVPFDDEDIARIHSIPKEAPHKEVDQWIFDNSNDITVAIIAPSTIYGIGSGPFKKVSQQVIALAKASVYRRKAGYVNNKEVRWGNVWINNLVDLYELVLEGLLEGKIEHGKQGGWYFGSYGEHTWGQVAEKLASVLHSKGLVDSLEVSPFEKDIIDKLLWGEFAKYVFAQESRAVANRSKKIGWKPQDKPTILDVIEEEVQYLIDNGLLPPNQ